MKSFALAALAGVSQAALMTEMDYSFMKYITKFAKFYETVEEFNMRRELFAASEQKIQELNAGNGAARFGHNHLSDFTPEEYSNMLGIKEELPQEENTEKFTGVPNGAIDWRTKGMVTPVKDQGQCGSCWAFSATESVESAYMIAGNAEVIMAPQELVDCSKGLFSNHGCNGGWYYYAWKWLESNKTMTEADYPYTSGTTGKETTCAYDASKGVTNVSSYKQVSEDTDSIKAALEQQPCSVAVSAGNDVFRYYTSGIVTESDGCPTQLDHAIQAVGWGSQDGQDYYIVRNSWNTTWGDKGYILIGTADGKGVCGINQAVYYPSV